MNLVVRRSYKDHVKLSFYTASGHHNSLESENNFNLPDMKYQSMGQLHVFLMVVLLLSHNYHCAPNDNKQMIPNDENSCHMNALFGSLSLADDSSRKSNKWLIHFSIYVYI